MCFIKLIIDLPNRKKNTDYDKIKVTTNGGFYMKSKDIFSDKIKSKELLSKLRESVEAYQQKT